LHSETLVETDIPIMDWCICVLNLLYKKKQKGLKTLRNIETKRPAKIKKEVGKQRGGIQFKHTMKNHLFSWEVKAKGKAFFFIYFFSKRSTTKRHMNDITVVLGNTGSRERVIGRNLDYLSGRLESEKKCINKEQQLIVLGKFH